MNMTLDEYCITMHTANCYTADCIMFMPSKTVTGTAEKLTYPQRLAERAMLHKNVVRMHTIQSPLLHFLAREIATAVSHINNFASIRVRWI